jgi:uncharacterized repeat protein (TIGR03803 family)
MTNSTQRLLVEGGCYSRVLHSFSRLLWFACVIAAASIVQAQTETVLHSFGAPPDGGNPEAGVIFDSAGNLYGTTIAGGASGGASSACPPVFQLDSGCGSVFKVDAAGNETVLYSFTGGTDGKQPWAGVIQDSAGNLYGTTQLGGAHGLGVVFKVDATGHETVLHSFAGSPDGN